MHSSDRDLFGIYAPAAGCEPLDASYDYDEALAQCCTLVVEDGYAQAEVRRGDRVCCTAYRDEDGHLRVLEEGVRALDDAIAEISPAGEPHSWPERPIAAARPPDAPAPPSGFGPGVDVSDSLSVSGWAHAPPIEGAAAMGDTLGEPTPPTSAASVISNTPMPLAGPRLRILGTDAAAQPVVWLGLHRDGTTAA